MMKTSLAYSFFLLSIFIAISQTNAHNLTIDQAVQSALVNRPSLKAVTAGIQASQFRAKSELVAYAPTVSISSDLSQHKGESSFGNTTMLHAQQLIFQHAGPLTKYEKGTTEAEIQEGYREREAHSIRFAVEKSFLECYDIQQQQAFTNALKKSAAVTYDKTKRERKISLINKQTYLERISDYSNDVIYIQNYAHDYLSARNKLSLLIAAPLEHTKLTWKQKKPHKTKPLAWYQEQAIKNRPDLKSSIKKVHALKLSEKITQSARLPIIAAQAEAGFSHYPTIANQLKKNQGTYSFGLTATWNIFDGTVSYFQELAAQAEKTRQILENEQLQLEIAQNVSDNYYELQKSLNILKSQRITYLKNKNSYNKKRLEYITGLISEEALSEKKADFERARAIYQSSKINTAIKECALLFSCGYPEVS